MLKNSQIVVLMEFGSHLYGTNTENSDKDYKGIFVPTLEQILLNNIPKSINMDTKKDNLAKNTSEDVDCEYYSLHYFLDLACKGETAALDMLHSPNTIQHNYIWKELTENKHRFYTSNLKSFVGYARTQAARYGIRGSRLNDAKKVIDFLADNFIDWIDTPTDEKMLIMNDLWDNLPTGEHIFKHEADQKGIKMYEVCGRKIQHTAKITYAYDTIKKFHDNYGERAKKAAKNEGIDWKAVSHALRAAYQVKQILTEGRITFPLREANYLKKVKLGELSFLNEVQPQLEELMVEVEELSFDSVLPLKVDRSYWDKWLCDILVFEHKNNILNYNYLK